jgi:hypothetical protein
MGLSFFGSSCSGCSSSEAIVKDKNPKPENFKILEAGFNKNFTIVKVKYPDCDNFEGIKILVYKGRVLKKLMKQELLDPHFCDNEHLSPIARFEPTEEGLQLALNLKYSK